MQLADFAAGCFQGGEGAFQDGSCCYSNQGGDIGGRSDNPCHDDLCSHATGHAETVNTTFDPGQVFYEQLLELLLECHDPPRLTYRNYHLRHGGGAISDN